MDIYALTRKRRPSRLTMAQTPSERLLLIPDSEDIIEPTISVVTGPPTKLHWKLDEDAIECTYPGCTKTFGFFERRHHCRKCGDIFCSTHCSNYLRLNQDSEFHSKGYLSRGCDLCAELWKNPSTSLTLSSSTSTCSETNEEKNKRDNKNRHAGIMTLKPHALEGVLELGRDDIVQSEEEDDGLNKPTDVFDNVAFSVPANWHWSTF